MLTGGHWSLPYKDKICVLKPFQSLLHLWTDGVRNLSIEGPASKRDEPPTTVIQNVAERSEESKATGRNTTSLLGVSVGFVEGLGLTKERRVGHSYRHTSTTLPAPCRKELELLKRAPRGNLGQVRATQKPSATARTPADAVHRPRQIRLPARLNNKSSLP